MIATKKRWLRALGALLVLGSGSWLLADPSFQVDWGFRKFAQSERPMPVRVDLQGDNVDRQLEIHILGSPSVRQRVELPRQTNKRVFLFTEPHTGLVASSYPILSINEGERQIHEEPLVTQFVETLVPVVGGSGAEFSGISTPRLGPEFLPVRPRGYSGLAGLIVYPAAWPKISPPALEAMRLWVADGGTLILPTIGGAQTLNLSAANPFGPISVGRAEQKRGLFASMSFELRRLNTRPTKFEPWDVVSLTSPPTGTKRLFPRDSRLPTIWSSRAYGRGNLYFLCFDPTLIPRKKWPSHRDLEDRLFNRRATFARVAASDERIAGVSPRAIAAVRSSASDVTANFWFFLFLVVYLLLITPGDYWLVRKFGRPRLTWITFPITVVVFTALAWALGQGRVGQLTQREVTFIDTTLPLVAGESSEYATSEGTSSDGGSYEKAFGHSVVGIYSDTNQTFSYRPIPELAEVRSVRRDSGGAITYLPRTGGEDLTQKMHIWADHEYRVIWNSEPLLTFATVVYSEDLTADGPRPDLVTVRVEGRLPRNPHCWVLMIGGERYEFLHKEALAIAGGWEFVLGATTSRLSATDWEEVGGGRTTQLVAANTEELYRQPDDPQKESPWVAAVLPGPWPSLELQQRDPVQFGVTIVRCAVHDEHVAAAEPESEADRRDAIDPVLDEER